MHWIKVETRYIEAKGPPLSPGVHYILYLRLSGVLVLKKETDTAGLLV